MAAELPVTATSSTPVRCRREARASELGFVFDVEPAWVRGHGVGGASLSQRGVMAATWRSSWASHAALGGGSASPSANACGSMHTRASRHVPRSAWAIVSAADWQAGWRHGARVMGSRSPATLARQLAGPVTPVIAVSPSRTGRFISWSVVCRWSRCGARCSITMARCRRRVRRTYRSASGRHEACTSPRGCSFCSPWAACQAVWRPGTVVTGRALTRDGVSPRCSSRSKRGPHETPVDASTTVSRWHVTSPSTNACRSGVTVSPTRTGSASRSGGTATTMARAPMSSPAAWGGRQGHASKRTRLGGAGQDSWSHLLESSRRTSPLPKNKERPDRGHRRHTTVAPRAEVTRERDPCGSTGSVAPVRGRVCAAGRRGGCMRHARGQRRRFLWREVIAHDHRLLQRTRTQRHFALLSAGR
jgi:hypothetical protein